MEPAATRNQITLRGSLLTLPQLSHENHNKQFFRFLLEVPRLSGVVDILPVIAEGSVLDTLDLSAVRYAPTTSGKTDDGTCPFLYLQPTSAPRTAKP